MERLTTNKDTSEMNMVELAHNSCYVKDHKARYRDYDTDIDARDLARNLMIKHGFWKIHENHNLTDEELLDDDVFDETMLDLLQYGHDDVEVLIALFYRNLWAMAELREALKLYEDTGLTPEKIMELDKMYQELSKEVMQYRKEAESNGWIPCNERLPETGETVIACTLNGTFAGKLEQESWYRENMFFYDSEILVRDVIAWQPLPKPYQKRLE